MKITDLELEDYGIYRDVSWRPAQDRLIVVMGENESGKTTLLNFIRDMLFGYRRGMWRGRMGNLGFRRADGEDWRVYRYEKDSWFEDAKQEKYNEELPALWWHGLSRAMYEQIFAVGLEDLQGAGFLSQDDVRSRFFMMQGGDRLALARSRFGTDMERFLLPTGQGKRKVNQLMEKLAASKEKLASLTTQEDDFAELQKKQAAIKAEISEIETRLAKEKEDARAYEKKLGAWKYYTRAREIKHRLALGEQVKMFPKNGKEQWNQLMSRMEALHGQREQLQKKLDEYTPRTKAEVIPWADAEEALEKLYMDLGQWSQSIEDKNELEAERKEWKIAFSHMGYDLPLWDRMLSPDEHFPMVNWDEGRKLAQSVIVRENELHFWEKREPAVEENEAAAEKPKETEEDWRAFEEKTNRIETLLHDEADLTEEWETLDRKEDTRYTVWFWIAAAGLLLTAGCLAAFYLAMAGVAAFYGAGAGAVLAAAGYFLNSRLAHKKEKDMARLSGELDALREERKQLADGLSIPVPEKVDDLHVFHNAVQQKRSEFYKAQAEAQALAWKRESLERQKKDHEKWQEEGEELRKEAERTEKAWEEWLTKNHLPKADAEALSQLQEEWQKIYSSQGAGKILDVRIEKTQDKLDDFVRRALAIIRTTGAALEASPETIADIYEENRKRLLAWESISEKNRQHETYEKEMAELQSRWDSCQSGMDALLSLVNAKNAEEFAERVTAHEQHDQLTKEWDSVRQDIRLYAGSEEDFNTLWASLESGEYDEWMEASKELEAKLADDEYRLGELRKQQGAAENEIYRLAADGTVTAALQERESIETELKKALSEWLTGLYASHFLEKAEKQYESGKRPKIIEKANGFLAKMTSGRYQLAVSEDGKEVCTIDRVQNKKDARIWSSGTGDQVYLALRLAMALAFGQQLETLPLVLDDIFVRFDEGRQRETLRFLMELGREQQIFLFTCHERTMRIAEEVGREMQTGSFIRLKSGSIASEETIG